MHKKLTFVKDRILEGNLELQEMFGDESMSDIVIFEYEINIFCEKCKFYV